MMIEITPARNATGIFSRISYTLVVAGELLVDSPLERRAQRGRPSRRPASTAPVPGECAEHERPADEAHDRQEPRQQVEALRSAAPRGSAARTRRRACP